MNKKILIVSHEFPPSIGGAGIVALQNARMLAAEGHDVDVLTIKREGTILNREQYNTITVESLSKFWILTLAWKLKRLPLNSYDTIILNDIGATIVFAMFFSNIIEIRKAIIYLHGGEVKKILENQSLLFKLFRIRQKYIELIQKVRSIIAVSEYMKSLFLSKLPNNSDKPNVQVVYAGVDMNMFYPQSSSLRDDFKISANKLIIISVSRITEQKGYLLMIEVFKKVISRRPIFHWVIVGNGPFLEKMKMLIGSYKLNEFISIVGEVPRNGLPYFYNGADLFWSLSKMESFGLTFIEAQACGVPVIGPNAYGVKEAVKEGVGGYLFNDLDLIVDVILGKRYLNLDKGQIVSYARQFSVDNQLAILENALFN